MQEMSQTGDDSIFWLLCPLWVKKHGPTWWAIIYSSCTSGTSTLATYYSNFMARHLYAQKCLKYRKMQYWHSVVGTRWFSSRQSYSFLYSFHFGVYIHSRCSHFMVSMKYEQREWRLPLRIHCECGAHHDG